MPSHRVYIDESGDHTYQSTEELSRRYLALTGVVVEKAHYGASIVPALNALKRKHFTYDPDSPVILHREDIVRRKRWFGVLVHPARATEWDADLVEFVTALQAQVFTVVIDKWAHNQRYGARRYHPYHYGLEVLLWQVRGYLHSQGAQADVFAEARGKRENAQLMQAYRDLLSRGATNRPAAAYRAAFPDDEITIRRKDYNILGLQIADLLVTEQKYAIAIREGKPIANEPSALAQRLTAAADHMINQDGRVWLE